VQRYCESEQIPILLEIPFQRAIAEGYARGKNLIETVPELRTVFSDLLTNIAFLVAK